MPNYSFSTGSMSHMFKRGDHIPFLPRFECVWVQWGAKLEEGGGTGERRRRYHKSLGAVLG